MTENPASWGEAEHVIRDAIDRHHENMAQGIIGVSIVRTITDALREAGLLTEWQPHPGGGAHVCSCGRRVQ